MIKLERCHNKEPRPYVRSRTRNMGYWCEVCGLESVARDSREKAMMTWNNKVKKNCKKVENK